MIITIISKRNEDKWAAAGTIAKALTDEAQEVTIELHDSSGGYIGQRADKDFRHTPKFKRRNRIRIFEIDPEEE